MIFRCVGVKHLLNLWTSCLDSHTQTFIRSVVHFNGDALTLPLPEGRRRTAGATFFSDSSPLALGTALLLFSH